MPVRPDVMEEFGSIRFWGNGILFIGDKGAPSMPGWGGRPSCLPGSRDR